MRWLIAIALAACAGGAKHAGTETDGTGAASGSETATGCDAITAKVDGLYRTESKATDELVADNTEMVMAICRRDPSAISTCIAGVTTVQDLETRCLPKLDEEGSEADVLVR